VPAGTIEDSEAPPAGALREAQEESGLDCLELVAFLGEQVRDMRDGGRDELHHRYFFHLRCTATPPGRWRNYEEFPSDRLAVGAVHTRPLFEFFWARLPHDVPALIADHGILLDRLIARLASHG
jgi:8-oxo-dGTP pyrophosphatase MutT (NUDIX family)